MSESNATAVLDASGADASTSTERIDALFKEINAAAAAPVEPEALSTPAEPAEPAADTEPDDEPDIYDLLDRADAGEKLSADEYAEIEQYHADQREAQQTEQRLLSMLPQAAQKITDKLAEMFGGNLSDVDKATINYEIKSLLTDGDGSVASSLRDIYVLPVTGILGRQTQQALVDAGMSNREARELLWEGKGLDLTELIPRIAEQFKKSAPSDKEIAKREKAAADARERELFAKYPDRFPAKPEDGTVVRRDPKTPPMRDGKIDVEAALNEIMRTPVA